MDKKQKTNNYDKILSASYRLFMSRKYEKVTMRNIQEECGVQTRGLYRYFKSKDEILGTIIELIEKKMLEYIQPVLTGEPLLSFVLFSIIKYEYAIDNPDYFRMRASFIARPDAFIKSFMELYELSFPQEHNWKTSEKTMLQGLYILGGMLLVQYGFIKNLSGNAFSEESKDFMTRYDIHKLSEKTTETYKRFMHYAIREDLHILGLSETDIENMITEARSRINNVDIHGFKAYYEHRLNFC